MPETNSSSPEQKILRVGVVEDDATLRLFLKKLIQTPAHGFEFIGAWESAEDAVKPLPDSRPHVVIVDLELPKVSGIELIRQMSPRLGNTVFVVLTIQDDPDKVFAALRAGAHGYLLKSSKPAEIAAGIRQADFFTSKLTIEDETVGVDDGNKSNRSKGAAAELTIAPNPSSGLLQISIPPGIAVAQVQLFNAVGVLLMRHRLGGDYRAGLTLDCSRFLPGLYLVEISTTNGKIERRPVMLQ